MTKALFKEFPEVSSKQWKQKIQVDLKGADYNDTLIWNTNEGIDVKPFYHSDEFEALRNVPKPSKEWRIGQTIDITSTEDANQQALKAVENGVEALYFNIADNDINLGQLTNDLDLKTTKVHLEGYPNTQMVNHSDISCHLDIIGNLAKTGNWYKDLKSDHSSFEQHVNSHKQLSVDGTLYQNAGATMVQQLGYAMAHANEYLNHLDSGDLIEIKSELKVTFRVAIGTNYFFEIAKLRALRVLWETLAEAYGINTTCYIIATPSKRNKTIYDYNTNMLRTTTECMSAVLGGADEVYNLPYDALYHKPNDFGDRISKNQLLVLKHESYFNKVTNPADGSYYIESLTEQLAQKGLELFKSIEEGGGFLSQLKEGTIQRKIKESADKEQEQFNTNELILLGTNKHPNPKDSMKNDLEISPFRNKVSRKTLLEPIIERRLAEDMDQKRLEDE